MSIFEENSKVLNDLDYNIKLDEMESNDSSEDERDCGMDEDEGVLTAVAVDEGESGGEKTECESENELGTLRVACLYSINASFRRLSICSLTILSYSFLNSS